MSRNMRSGGGRSRMGSGDYGGARGYDGPGGGYGNRGGQGLLDSYGAGGGYEVDSLIHQRSLQQQLSLRESQLALANSLLQQQHQSYLMDGPGMGMRGPGALGPGPGPLGMGPRMMINKRRMDMRPDDYGLDFKRPRNDFSPRPRDRYRSRDSDDGNRSSHSRRSQTSSSRSYSGRSRGSSDKYDPEKPTADDDKDGGGQGKSEDPYHCHVCNVNCRDNEGFRRHMNSMRHNDRMMGMLAIHEEKTTQIASRMKAEKHLRHVEDEDKVTRGFCKICDMALKVRYVDHQAMTFHRKRVKQVTKGCGWCGMPAFKNFTEVLAHRDTEEHKKNQEKHEKEDKPKKDTDGSRKRAPIRVEIPADLARYNADITYGQMCVIPVSGWFCKLCNKFYNNESAAKETHCKTEEHYVKYKRFVYAKLRAKAEAEREVAEKAEAEKEGGGEEEQENGAADKDDSFEKEEEDGAGEEGMEDVEEGGGEEEDAAEEDVGEGGEEEEDAMLGMDGSAGEYLDEDIEENAEGCLLQDTREASDYHTADDTTGADNTVNREEEEEEDQGEGEETSAISLMAGESGSEFLTSEITTDLAVGDGEEEEEEEQDLEGEGSMSQEKEGDSLPTRATRAAVSTSTPVPGGRVNKARRGRKVAK
ncbi:uncharacterized protein LOC143289763 [Babylonia areolata]|uniref:uncharacterized protein LOC143289763 n=1 Tax=Babylonia areolata TaxID=304850 RepID=UPI003FD3F047